MTVTEKVTLKLLVANVMAMDMWNVRTAWVQGMLDVVYIAVEMVRKYASFAMAMVENIINYLIGMTIVSCAPDKDLNYVHTAMVPAIVAVCIVVAKKKYNVRSVAAKE